jgi:Leucine-rich repeat (LRR) protein
MRCNNLITDLNHSIALTELDIQYTNVKQTGIEKLINLTQLDIYGNTLITELNHLIALTKLDIRHTNVAHKKIKN